MGLTVGSLIRLSYTVRDDAGALADPATVELQITLPDRITVVTVNPTLPPATTGIVIYDYQTVQVGRHDVLWTTTGPITSDTSVFNIDANSHPGIFPLVEGKNYLNEPLDDTSNDDEIEEMIYAVTEIVESKIGPVIPKTYIEKVDSGWALPLLHGPIVSITSIEPWMSGIGSETVDVSTVTPDYETWCLYRDIGFWRGPYKVTYLAGRTTLSYSIILAAKALLDHFWESQRGPSLVGPGPDNETEDESFSVSGKVWTVPRGILELLQPEESGPRLV